MSVRDETMPLLTKNLAGVGRAIGAPPARAARAGRRATVDRAGPGRPARRGDRSAPRARPAEAYHRRMLLAIDVGNTNLRLGTVRDGVLGGHPAGRDAGRRHARRGRDPPRGAPGPRRPSPRRRRRRSSSPPPCPAVAAAVETVAARRTIACVTASAGTVPLPGPRRAARRRRAGPARERLRGRPPLRHARPSSSTAAPPRRSTRSTTPAPSSAARSPRASSWASRRSRRGRRACRGWSRASPTARSGATRPPRSGPGPSSATGR